MQDLFWFAPVGSTIALIFAALMVLQIIKAPRGTSAITMVQDAIAEGANAYLKRQYTVVSIFFIVVFGMSLTLALVATNQFHSWAHSASPPRIVRRLQSWGLILTPKAHARHHRGNHDRAYCVTSGWLNPLIDRTRFFERLERKTSANSKQRGRAT